MRKFKEEQYNIEFAPCLHSYEEFITWYLSRKDFSMFGQVEIFELLQEMRPLYYPCIPVIKEDELEIYEFITPQYIKLWCNHLDYKDLNLF